MPVDADALDQIALGVTQSLARNRRPERQAELDEHARSFAAAIASGKAVFTLADANAPIPARLQALEMALRDLFEGLARRGLLGGALTQVVARSRPDGGKAPSGDSDSPDAGEVDRARSILDLCELARVGPEAAEPAAVSRAVEQLIADGRLAAELRWFVGEQLFTVEQVAGWLQRLGRSARRRLLSTLRSSEVPSGPEPYPFIPRPLVGTALAAGPGSTGGELPAGSGVGSGLAQHVDAAVRAAARGAPTLAAYKAMRAARRRLDDDGWAGAARRFQEATGALVALVMELEASAADASVTIDRWAVEKRIESVAMRQDRIRATLPQLRSDYHQSMDAYLAAEREWKRAFKAQVVEAARAGEWKEEAIRYLGEEYPQLAVTAAELRAEVAPAPPPPPSTGPTDLPRAPTPAGHAAEAGTSAPAAPATDDGGGAAGAGPVPVPDGAPARVAAPVKAGEARKQRVSGRTEGSTPPQPHAELGRGRRPGFGMRPERRLAVLAPVAAIAGIVAGFALGGPGTQQPRPPVVPSESVSTQVVGSPLPGNHVILHLKAVTAKDGTALGPYDETDGAGTVECSPNLTRFAATTMTGQPYEVRATPADTVVSFGGDRASLTGTALATNGGGIAEGRVRVNSAAKEPVGTVSVQGSCAGATAPPQVNMALAIPPGVRIDAVPDSIAVGFDPGAVGIVGGALLVAAGVALIIRGRRRSEYRLLLAPVVLLAGGLLLGFSAHRTAVSRDAAPVVPTAARTPGCGGCPDGIRLVSAEVQARAGSRLFIFRGSWPASPARSSADLRLVAGGFEVVLRPRQDPAGYQVVAANLNGAALPTARVAVGLRPGVLLIDVGGAELTQPVHFEFGVWNGATYAGRIPATGALVWNGRGAPRGNPDSSSNPSASPSVTPAPAVSTAPSPASPPAPMPTPPGLDLTSLAATCPALKSGRIAEDLTRSSLVAGTVPDLVTSAPAHYFGAYFDKAAFPGDLAGHSPFSVTLTVQRAVVAGSGPHAIDRVGSIQLWAYWDGKALHRGSRTFAAGAWTMRVDDAATDLPSVEVRRTGLVFYWNGSKTGDKAGVVASDGHGCSAYGISDLNAPAIGIA